MPGTPIVSESGREVTIDDIIVLVVCKTVDGWRWYSSIWMRSSRRTNFKTPEAALSAGRKALNL